MIKVLQFFLLLFLMPILGYSQENSGPGITKGKSALSAEAHAGFVIAHRGDIRHLQRGHALGFEFDWTKTTDGSKLWHQYYVLPEYGVSYLFFDLGNPDVLGNAHALVAFLNLPLRNSKNFAWQSRVALGPGWIDKPFKSDDNTKDIAIGSHINLVAHFKLGYQLRLFKNIWWDMNAGLTHWSNGSVRVPNLGINVASLSSGFKYYIGESVNTDVMKPPVVNADWQSRIGVGVGIKEIYPPGGDLYPIYSINLNRAYRKNYKNVYSAGIDIFYDPSISGKLEYEKPDTEIKGSDDWRIGIHGAYEMKISAITLLINMGAYVHNPYKDDGILYHRLGARFAAGDRLDIFWKLKTHYARADFMEWGLEYKLSGK